MNRLDGHDVRRLVGTARGLGFRARRLRARLDGRGGRLLRRIEKRRVARQRQIGLIVLRVRVARREVALGVGAAAD